MPPEMRADLEATQGQFDRSQMRELSPDEPRVNINYSPTVTIPHGMYVHSYNPPCRGEQGSGVDWSSCGICKVDLPLGAQIIAVHYYAKLLDQDGGAWVEVSAGQDVKWALFERYVETDLGQNTTITARFKNWSHGADRQAQIKVEWKLPQFSTVSIRCC